MLIPESTACRSISASSSAVNGAACAAARFSSSCATLLAPISTDVTRWSRSAQDSASWASDWPRRRAISSSARTWASVCSFSWSVDSEDPSAGPRAGRDAVGYLPVSTPCASGENAMQPMPSPAEHVEQPCLDPAVEHRIGGLVDQKRRAQPPRVFQPPAESVRQNKRKYPRKALFPNGQRYSARPSSLRAGCPGRTGGCRKCPRNPGPSWPATDPGWPAGTCASRGRHKGRATCRSRPWSR